MQFKRTWRPVDGVLLLDKPLGLSSNDALQKVRRLFSAARGGHTGTLDPLATGLLPLCFGEATKFSADLLDADKTYVADVRLGITTVGGDCEGEIIEQRPVMVDRAALEAALVPFRGTIEQVPPMHSAIKLNGRPLYELARKGVEVERKARVVTIHHLQLLDFAGDIARLEVTCSKGTYIRSLAIDLGEALGCGAHLAGLRRTRVGFLEVATAHTLEALTALDESQRDALLAPVDALLQDLPAITLNAAQYERFSHGNPVPVAGGPSGPCRVYAENPAGAYLLGIGLAEQGSLKPKRLIRQENP